MTHPSSVQDIRHANLLALRDRCGSVAALERATHISYQYLTQLINRKSHSKSGHERGMGNVIARRIEAAFGLPVNAMDHPHAAEKVRSESGPLPRLPDAPHASHPAATSLAEVRSQYAATQPGPAWPFRGITPADWRALDDADRAAVEIYARALCDKSIARGA